MLILLRSPMAFTMYLASTLYPALMGSQTSGGHLSQSKSAWVWNMQPYFSSAMSLMAGSMACWVCSLGPGWAVGV